MVVIEIPDDMLSGTNFAFYLSRRSLTSKSGFSAHVRASGPIDERWLAEITLPARKAREDSDRFDAIFDRAGGMSGVLSAFSTVHAIPRGTATGLGGAGVPFSDDATFSDGSLFASGISQSTVGAAGARGSEFVTISGLLASQSVGFAIGDMFAIAQGSANYGFLHKAITNAPTDASGVATVQIRPRLREAVAVGQVVHFHKARGVFRVAEDNAHFVSRGPGGIGQARISLVELPEALTC